MLGKRHRPNLSRTASKPLLLSSSHGHGEERVDVGRVVIGFKLDMTENRNPNHPSTQEPNSRSSYTHSSHGCSRVTNRSPRSVLGSLLSASQGPAAQGVGLGILAVIKAEEVVAEAAAKDQAKTFQKSDPIAISGQSQHTLHEEGLANGRSQYGSSPQRKKLNTKDGQEEDNDGAEFPGLALLRGSRKGVEADVIKEEEEEEEEENDDGGEEEIDSGKPIFSAASPASNSCSYGFQDAHFLSFCCLCKRSLAQGRDIYMYRGDQAFCSAECRHRQISVDDHKERVAAVAPNCSTDCHNRGLAVAPAAIA